MKQVAPLRARYGSFGTFEALRTIELAKIATVIRAQALLDGKKLSNDEIKERAHADGKYADFVIEATHQRANWTILENRITGIADLVNRGQAIFRMLAAEAGLSR